MWDSLFNPDNAVMSFVNKVIDLVVLSLVWTACCLPILTIGPACAALYYAVVKAVRRQRSHAVKEFLRGFKSNLKNGMLFEFIWLLLAFMMFVTDVPLVLTFLDTGKIQNVMWLILFLVKAVLLVGTACWIYPLMSRFEGSLWKLAQASVYTLLRHFVITILAVLLVIIAAALLLTEPLLCAFFPGICTFLLSFLLEPALRNMCESPDDQTDAWYME